MITLTEKASKKVSEFIKSEIESGKLDKSKEYGLRVGIMGGGCSGFQYVLDFDTQSTDDHVFEFSGTKVWVDPKSLLYLSGTEIDYAETPFHSGFKVNNPNVKGSCGCGESVNF
ncbi:MAG: iron-sulfur cluster assembly accessory protein [Planctomycetes bacterium]|nr:iron-sulfur cluster assembly accessory protein [Planctomycetota bacterium]